MVSGSASCRALLWGVVGLFVASCASDGSPSSTGWWAVGGKADESGPGLATELDLPAAFEERYLPRHQTGLLATFSGVRDVDIAFGGWISPDAPATIVIFPGRGEAHVKYAELITDLTDRGLNVFVIDHRGQGFSGRMLDDPEKGHLDSWDYYVQDAHSFISRIVAAETEGPLYGLGHSMGGAIMTAYAIAHPDVFDAIVLSAPMHGINYGEYSETEAYAIAIVAPNATYAFGEGPYTPDPPFEGNPFTTSEARFAMGVRINEELYTETRLGGVTFGWITETVVGMRALREGAPALSTPTLLLSASDDAIVDNEWQGMVCDLAPDCELVTIEGARHELLMERDDLRNEALRRTLAFFGEH